MHAWKLRSLISASLLLIISSSLYPRHDPQQKQLLVSAPAQMQVLNLVADGTGPVPPFPPTQLLNLVADGTGPVPPYPPTQLLNLVADGTGPVPPFPPTQLLNLVADGTGPVPPYPRNSMNVDLFAA
jgi:hypothetical protein